MSYLVLARKWRPSTFEEVVGQSHITQTLVNAIKADRVAHALLFTGSRGVGKTSCARILAKALNCKNGPTPRPCGQCEICAEITAGTSVDVFEIDGASNNSVEQIREIRESVKFVPSKGKRKIYIIDEVHMLTTAAFNALLKTLEEPPAHVLFIFATTEPHKIPETIHSRCQRFDFKRIPEREIIGALVRIAEAEGISVEPAAFAHVAREAKGGMRDSLSLLDQLIAFCGEVITEAQTREVLGVADRRTLHNLTDAVLVGDADAALRVIDELFRHGLDLQKFSAEFARHVRDLMVVRVCQHPGRLVDMSESALEHLRDQVQDVAPAQLHRVFNALLRGAEEIARSPFPKLLFEMTLLRLCEQGHTLPLAEVLDGLARLEARLDIDPGAEAPPSVGGSGGGRRIERPSSTSAAPAAPAASTSAALAAPASPTPASPTPVAAAATPPTPVAAAPTVPTVAAPTAPTPAAPTAPTPAAPTAPTPAAPTAPTPAAPTAPTPAAPTAPTPAVVPAAVELAPVSQPAISSTLFDDRPAMVRFATLVNLLRAKDRFVAARIGQFVRVIRFVPEALHVAIPRMDGEGLRLGLGELERLLSEQVGAPVPLVITQCEPGDPDLSGETLFERAERLDEARRQSRMTVARQDPMVQAAISALGAEVEMINPR